MMGDGTSTSTVAEASEETAEADDAIAATVEVAENPRTGDSAPIAVLIGLLAVSALLLVRRMKWKTKS
jgi:hypothetical protein